MIDWNFVSNSTAVSFRSSIQTLPHWSTEITADSVCWLACPVLLSGSFTSTWDWLMSGAVTMKMTSSTSMTSTSGVTLMSARLVPADSSSPPSAWRANAMVFSAHAAWLEEVPIDDVQEVAGEVLHLRGEHLNPVEEHVVEDDRRDRGEESDGGSDQGLGDPRGHRLDGGVAGGAGEGLEAGHDPPHRSEQPDERRGGGHGGEEGDGALQAGHLAPLLPLHRPLDRFQVARLTLLGAAGEPSAGLGHLHQLHVAGPEDRGDGGAGVLLRLPVEALQLVAGPEAVEEGAGAPLRPGEGEELHQDDGPGDHREREQEEHHQLHHQAGVQNEVEDGVAGQLG